MRDFFTAVGLVLVIEGSIYALMPAAMKRMMKQAQRIPDGVLRLAGLAAAVAGLALVWWIRG